MANNKNRRNQSQQNQQQLNNPQQNNPQQNNPQSNNQQSNNQQPKSWQHNQQQPNKQQPNDQAQNGQNNPNINNGTYISPNYKGKYPNGGYKYNSTNGSQNEQEGQKGQKQNDKPSSKMDSQRQELHESWLKQQHDQKRKLEKETAELLQKEQRDFLARSSKPSAETIHAFQNMKELFRIQLIRELSESEFGDKWIAFHTMQSHFNQQPHKDETTQQPLSVLDMSIRACPTHVITNPATVETLGTAIADLEARLAMTMSEHGEGGSEPLSWVRNDLQPPKMPALTKQPKPANQTYQTKAHVEDLLNNFDAWLRQYGVTATRVTSDTVYYHCPAATEEERKKERRFVDIAAHPGYVKLEGHDNINADAAILRAAEHAYIVWSAQNQAAEALSKAKEAEMRVLQNVARVHPEARKQLETFEKGLEVERLQLVHREMQAQLNFEQRQREQLQKLNERLEQQRREFLGIGTCEAKPTERSYLPPTSNYLNPADINYSSRLNYDSLLFSGITSPAKPAHPTVPPAVKKAQQEKKSFYPRFVHASSLFRVEKYGGDPTVVGHLEKDAEGEIVQFRPWKAPCVPGCRECSKYKY